LAPGIDELPLQSPGAQKAAHKLVDIEHDPKHGCAGARP
jgi:hypothetical protein